MNEKLYGYVRVSTKEQNWDRQILAMREFGIPDKQIYREKLSGKDFERPVYLRLLRKFKPGDTFVIKSIDRLGRNYDEILEQWRVITREKKAAIVVLDMPLLDTRQGEGSDGDTDCRHRFTDAKLCGADGTRIHPSAAGRGDCSSEGERSSIWPKSNGKAK